MFTGISQTVINIVLAVSLVAGGLFYVYSKGKAAGISEVEAKYQAASEAAVRENEQIAKEESREITKVMADLENMRAFYRDLLLKSTRLNKQPVVIHEDPVTNVKTIRIFGLSDDALSLFNDGIRGEERTPEVRPNFTPSLSR